ncbi:hypothetical protein V1515DRAFT_624467 [Lipomyces mesembrius]
MPNNKYPLLPPGGDSTIFSTISQSLSFHASPESFLSSRQITDERATKEIGSNLQSKVVRAKIINRDVAIVSSYRTCEDILKAADGITQSPVIPAQEGEIISRSTFDVQRAYQHDTGGEKWNEHMSAVTNGSSTVIRVTIAEDIATWSNGSTIDLYKTMKDLSWKILLGTLQLIVFIIGVPARSAARRAPRINITES